MKPPVVPREGLPALAHFRVETTGKLTDNERCALSAAHRGWCQTTPRQRDDAIRRCNNNDLRNATLGKSYTSNESLPPSKPPPSNVPPVSKLSLPAPASSLALVNGNAWSYDVPGSGRCDASPPNSPAACA